jgi:hypothetical protein
MRRHVLTGSAVLASPFVVDLTSPAPFTRLDGSDVQIELMRGADTERPTVQTDAFAAVGLRDAGDLTMLLIVSEEGHHPGVEARLVDGLIAEIDAEAADRNVAVLLPRFRSETDLHLRDLLEGALGAGTCSASRASRASVPSSPSRT